jgi:hypothetical protein
MWAQQEQCSPARIVSEAGSLKSLGKFEEPGQEGWGRFFSKAASKGLPRPFNAVGWRCFKSRHHKQETCYNHIGLWAKIMNSILGINTYDMFYVIIYREFFF